MRTSPLVQTKFPKIKYRQSKQATKVPKENQNKEAELAMKIENQQGGRPFQGMTYNTICMATCLLGRIHGCAWEECALVNRGTCPFP